MYAGEPVMHRYDQPLSDQLPTRFLFRQNIHRLEKGLIMRPQRTLFDVVYIAETSDYFTRCSAMKLHTGIEHRWACGVIEVYFIQVEPIPLID